MSSDFSIQARPRALNLTEKLPDSTAKRLETRIWAPTQTSTTSIKDFTWSLGTEDCEKPIQQLYKATVECSTSKQLSLSWSSAQSRLPPMTESHSGSQALWDSSVLALSRSASSENTTDEEVQSPPINQSPAETSRTQQQISRTSEGIKTVKDTLPNKTEIIIALRLEGYTPLIQKKIIDCYTSQKTTLDLRGCGLSEIPTCLSTDFPWLSKLNLSNNQLTSCFFKHDRLIDLNLSKNKLSTVDIDCTKLETLNLSNNKLTHFDPADHFVNLDDSMSPFLNSAKGLPALIDLNIANNELTSLPKNLQFLHKLRCEGNNLTKTQKPTSQFNLHPTDKKTISKALTDKGTLSQTLDLTGYSVKVQTKIIDCYLAQEESLDLSSCGLTEIPSCLSDFPWLCDLNLSQNNLTSCIFEHRELLSLNLSKNKLTVVNIDCGNLKTLNLFQNQLADFDGAGHLKALENLNIAKNSLSELPKNLPALKHLHYQGNKLTKMPDLKNQFQCLEYLHVDITTGAKRSSHNKLQEFKDLAERAEELGLENYSFDIQLKIINCDKEKNKTLDLSGCGLTEIPPCLSTDFPWLSNLDLSNNKLTTCSLRHPNLSKLHLKNNQLTTFTALIPMIALLDLSNNQIERFRIDPKNFTKLETLIFSNNQLTKFTLNLTNLKNLQLDNNKIKTLDLDFPISEEPNIDIDLSSSVDSSELLVLKDPGSSHSNLVLLDLSGNQFDKFEAPFGMFPKLRNLFMDNNKLTDLPKNLPSLEELSCKNNQIAKIAARPSHFPNLTFLDIKGNKLSSPLTTKFPKLNSESLQTDFNDFLVDVQRLKLENYSFDVQQKIITCLRDKSPSLDLSNCNLTQLPRCIESHLSHIKDLNLSHNNFSGVFRISRKHLGLENLDLSFNKITGFNKDKVADGSSVYTSTPPNLKKLDLSHNEFQIFTSRPGNLDKLEDLNLASNKLSVFSASKDQYPELEHLDLSFNPDLSEDNINFYDELEIIPIFLKTP